MDNNYDRVYQLKIVLEDVEPKIWRRIQVPATYSFYDLHEAIQDAMGWLNSHLYFFLITNPATGDEEELACDIDLSFERDHEVILSRDRKIADYFSPENKKGFYIYDFGDNWGHIIKFERILPRQKEITYPLCLAGENACPPEDCGGAPGYEEIRQILSDPSNEEYEELIEWLGEGFDPNYFNVDEIVFGDHEKECEGQYAEPCGRQEEYAKSRDENKRETTSFPSKFLKNIWEKVKTGDLKGLSPEELKVARLMKEHEDQFFNQFEFADLLVDNDYNPDRGINPFLHIFIHSLIDKQLESRNPIEAEQFYNAMIKKDCSHHEAIHLTGAIFSLFLPAIFNNTGPV